MSNKITPSAFIAIGHGGSDPGAVAYGLKEKDINLVVGLACGRELERYGVKVFYSRKKDENDPVSQEVKEADARGADINVAFHANAGRGDGSETFCNEENEEGVRLAKLMEEYAQKAGQNSRGVKDGMHLKFVRATKKTTVLHECAFLDNDKDNDIIDTRVEQELYGKMQARAILDYFGIDYKKPVEENSKAKPFANGPYNRKVRLTANLNVRAGRGVEYKKLGLLKEGTVLEVLYILKKNGSYWGSIDYGENVGFICLDYAEPV